MWGKIEKLLWREGAKPAVSEKFHSAVVQAVLLFGEETWVITETMMQRLEVAHVSFLCQVTRKQANRQRDGSWRQVTEESVLQVGGT